MRKRGNQPEIQRQKRKKKQKKEMREERRERRGQEKYDIGKMREREKYIIPTIARRINSQ